MSDELTTSEKVERLRTVIGAANDFPDNLSQWEKDFLSDFEKKLDQYGDRTRISDKQWVIIERIEGKV